MLVHLASSLLNRLREDADGLPWYWGYHSHLMQILSVSSFFLLATARLFSHGVWMVLVLKLNPKYYIESDAISISSAPSNILPTNPTISSLSNHSSSAPWPGSFEHRPR